MDRERLREELAQLAHDDQWSGWMRYFIDKCQINDDGSLTVHADYVAALRRQMTTPYSVLTEAEKQSDREEADKVIALLQRAGIEI